MMIVKLLYMSSGFLLCLWFSLQEFFSCKI